MMSDIDDEQRLAMSTLVRHLRVTRHAQGGLPAIVLAYTRARRGGGG